MSDPVVEELLEKGARAAFPNAWAASWPGTGGEAVKAQLWAVETVGTVLDAVFPGWREGLTRVQRVAYPTDRVERRWVGPWVPVEEGTDG